MSGTARPFRFGVLSGVFSWSKRELQEKARRAEGQGYDVFQMCDHVAGPGPVMEAAGHPPAGLAVVPALMALADATDHLRVGSLVCCVDYHHPVVLASEMATIDLLSDGRLELGLGAGWFAGEYNALGIPFDPAPERIDRLAEAVTLLTLLFSDGQVSFHGKHFQVEGFEGAPKPVQRPYPPIVIGGGSRRVLQLAGRAADVVSLNYAWPDDNRSALLGTDILQRSAEEATLQKIQWIREGAGDRFDNVEIQIGAYMTTITDHPASVADDLSTMSGIPASDIMSHPHVLIGSTESICEELLRRRELYGFSCVSIGDHLIDAFSPVVRRLAGS